MKTVSNFPVAIRLPDFLFIVIPYFNIDLICSPLIPVLFMGFPNILSIFRLFPKDRLGRGGFGFWWRAAGSFAATLTGRTVLLSLRVLY
jgi:hypothetical protein